MIGAPCFLASGLLLGLGNAGDEVDKTFPIAIRRYRRNLCFGTREAFPEVLKVLDEAILRQ